MSGLDRDDTRPEVVSFGSTRRPVLSVGIAVGLLLGVLGGSVLTGRATPGDPAGAPGLVAAAVEHPDSANADGPVFTLPVRNGGDETVQVRGLVFDGVGAALVVAAGPVPPATWGDVRFVVSADCAAEPPRSLDTVRLSLRTGGGEVEEEVALAGGGHSILDYHAAVCGRGALPRPRDLVGTWVLEEAFGAQAFVGVMVWVLSPDGTFVADPEGLAQLDVEHGVEGRYALQEGELRLHATGGYGGCDPGDVSRWRPDLVEGRVRNTVGETPPLMRLSWLGGACPDDLTGQVWVMRRVLDGAR